MGAPASLPFPLSGFRAGGGNPGQADLKRTSPTILQNLIAGAVSAMGTGPGPGPAENLPCEHLHRALLWEPVTQSLALVPSLSCDIRQIKAPL